MKLLTDEQRERLLANGRLRKQLDDEMRQRDTEPDSEIDFLPVVKLFTPDAGCTWLLSELDPNEPNLAFGLCDLGMGCPELGYVNLTELESVRGKLGLPVERDLHFTARKTISAYAEEARRQGGISA